MEPIVYRKMNTGEERAVCDLVALVFNKYVAPDYGQDGIKEFFRFANTDAMKERMKSDGFVLVAQQADSLVGILEFYPPDIIAMLFVTIQHQGVAKELLAQAISKVRVLNPDLSKLTVHSSPYAEPIYKKMGFYRTGNTTTENGITYVPMELLLNDECA